MTNGCGTVTTSNVVLTVNAACVAPSISVQPTAQNVTAPLTATFTVTAGGTAPTYQWQRAEPATPTAFSNVPSGGTTISYTTAATAVATDNGAAYRCVVTNGCGTVNSNSVTLTVAAGCTAPAISTQPTPQTVITPATATFTVAATGTSLTYQWQHQRFLRMFPRVPEERRHHTRLRQRRWRPITGRRIIVS